MLNLIFLGLTLVSPMVFAGPSSKLGMEDFRSYYSEAFPESWKKEGGCYVLDSLGFGSDLMTKKTYSEFELEFEWSIEKGGNSGVLFAVQEGEYYSYLTGLEIQLLDDLNHPDGISDITSLGALYGLSSPNAAAKRELRIKKINQSLLIVEKESVKFYVNGVLIAKHQLDQTLMDEIKGSKFSDFKNFYKNPRGHIVFQDHGGKTSICNVRIREL
jgi:hypothetical protein